jgi:hypothetical protein
VVQVDFGSVLNHDKRSQVVYLVNSSAHRVSCTVELGSAADMKTAPGGGTGAEAPEGDNPYASIVAAARARSEALAAASTAPFTVKPTHVVIPAFQKVPVKICYSPLHTPARSGFSSTMKTGTTLHNYTAVIEIAGETKRVSRLSLKGKCLFSVAEVSPAALHFEEKPGAASKRLQLLVKNRAKSVPIWYNFSELPAFFHVQPRSGTIPAEATTAVDVVYKPKALGTQEGKLRVSVRTEHGCTVEEHSIYVHGVCSNPEAVLHKDLKRISQSNKAGKLAASPNASKSRSQARLPYKATLGDIDMGNVRWDDLGDGDPGLTKMVDGLWLATKNMPATYTPVPAFAADAVKKMVIFKVRCWSSCQC